MKLVIEKDVKAMSENAMYILLGAMLQDKRVNISLTSGRTPRLLYEMMIPLVRDQKKLRMWNIIYLMKIHLLVKNMEQTGLK